MVPFRLSQECLQSHKSRFARGDKFLFDVLGEGTRSQVVGKKPEVSGARIFVSESTLSKKKKITVQL